MSVGRAPLMTPLANPIAKPPRVAVQSRSIPPTTTPTRTTIVSLSAKSGCDERELDGQDHRDRRREHAREQDGDADHGVGADAEQPRGAEVRRGGAHVQAERRPPEQQREQRRASRPRRRRRGSSPCGRRRRRSRPPGSATRATTAGSPIVPSRMSRISATLWSRNATANVVTSITAGEAVRSGRKTARSIRNEQRDHDREAGDDARRDRPARREGERVGAGHDQLPVGEVDEPEHAEDEPDPDRHQRVDGAEADGVDERLGIDRGERQAHARYAAIIFSVSSASAGVRVIRSSPFAST